MGLWAVDDCLTGDGKHAANRHLHGELTALACGTSSAISHHTTRHSGKPGGVPTPAFFAYPLEYPLPILFLRKMAMVDQAPPFRRRAALQC